MLRKQRRVRWCSLIGFIMRIQSAKEEIMFSISNKCSHNVTYQSNVDPPTLCTLSIEATLLPFKVLAVPFDTKSSCLSVCPFSFFARIFCLGFIVL